MKGKVVLLVLLVLACAGLAIGLVSLKNKTDEERADAQAKIQQLSKEWKDTSTLLEEQKQVNASLNNTLTVRTTELEVASNRLENVKGELSQTQTKAQADAQVAQEEIKRREAKISELEGRNEDLTKKMGDLNVSIQDLERQIDDTQRKLAASEGDREFLLAELKRLQSEKADLERQFNDLALLRDQINKLKEELSIARRLEWIRRGLYGNESKGSEKLQSGFATPAGQGADLNVEIRQDGGAKVVPATNAPAAKP